MSFDFAYFAKALCMIGGILYFQDIFLVCLARLKH